MLPALPGMVKRDSVQKQTQYSGAGAGKLQKHFK